MSLSLDEEDDDIGAPSSPVHERSNKEEEGEAHSTEEVAANDVAGPQLSKATVKTAMKGAKRVDEIALNMILNQTILDHYHNVREPGKGQGNLLIFLPQERLGGGTWTTKAKKKIREKYYVAREQHVRIKAPTLKVGI